MRNIVLFMALLFALPTKALEFPVEAGIYLVDMQMQEVRIGEIKFSKVTAESTSVSIEVEIDRSVFSEHFLSMRPFRCLTGDEEWFCYLEYPYELRSIISPEDLSDLEYQLLFIRKTPQEFGIDAWNGLYYKLKLEKDGTISGRLWEGDLNSLQSPPSEKYAKPVELDEFIVGDESRRLFPWIKVY